MTARRGLEVAVSDPGPPRQGHGAAPGRGCSLGFGLGQLAAEVAGAGGALSWGSDHAGGFTLRARLPLGDLPLVQAQGH